MNRPLLICTLKIATSIIKAAARAAGRVSKPKINAKPPKNSAPPASCATSRPGSRPILLSHCATLGSLLGVVQRLQQRLQPANPSQPGTQPAPKTARFTLQALGLSFQDG